MRHSFLILALALTGGVFAPPVLSEVPAGKGVLVDSVVASVDGNPITLRDLGRRVGHPVAMTELSHNAEVQQALDALIQDSVLRAEADQRHIAVAPEELEHYLGQVAQRNNMNVDDLKRAVAGQGKSFDSYKEEVRLDIMKSKLASTMMRNSVAVSDKEVDAYLAESEGTAPVAPKEGRKVNLSQIMLSFGGKSLVELEKKVAALEQRFKDGDDFDDVAREASEGKDAAEGGSLGDLHEADLSPEIRAAVEGLADGETSKAIHVGNSIRFMHVNHWIKPADPGTTAEPTGASPEKRDEARAILQQQKVQAKMMNFFSEEIMKLHSVDKTFEIAQNH